MPPPTKKQWQASRFLDLYSSDRGENLIIESDHNDVEDDVVHFSTFPRSEESLGDSIGEKLAVLVYQSLGTFVN